MNQTLYLIRQFGVLPCIPTLQGIDISTLNNTLINSGIPYICLETESSHVSPVLDSDVILLNLSSSEKQYLLKENVRFITIPSQLCSPNESENLSKFLRSEIDKILDLKLIHIGINSKNEGEAGEITRQYGSLLNLPVKDTRDSFFVGTLIEVMKHPFLGKNGHIALGTGNIHLAVSYYHALGYEFNFDTAVYNASKELVLIYLKEEYGGFALHFKQV
ncbi:hypothetical protein [Ruminiclostridium cellobioparum]|uniref:Uncharacterized protein n=1 Tax=Ruminiclostridium cellobioparum subsp. termitidis CT1112 TaxID=1195236 RepID=S0FIS7_RUMCE|nr:hypothetical protein [Ruminiclostridium cellobioparum]EMS69004.1 hypothetical protein CTER_5407 [Ruminiclostridium cellobioparum subsp. termitidis CT1112]